MITDNIIGTSTAGTSAQHFTAVNPATNETLPGEFQAATRAEVEAAVRLATEAAPAFRNSSPEARAAFLDAIADGILALGDTLVHRAMAESGLPEGRIRGERGRTMNQLKLFATLIREGHWVEATIDHALPDRQPLPKADIRKMLVALGPVVVFGASNFPLAFSTAGGDTASALAAGCPVIVKAHPAHPGTSSLIAEAIRGAAAATNMPAGVFSHLLDEGLKVGQTLVQHPDVKAVAFTGSLRGGRALYDLAAARPEPIPVFAEMGSINPVLLSPGALKSRGKVLAHQMAGSVCLGVGQFCTNPGLLLALAGEETDAFLGWMGEALANTASATMLTSGIAGNFRKLQAEARATDGVTTVIEPPSSLTGAEGMPSLATVSATEFIAHPRLREEVFGPFTLLVQCRDTAEMAAVIDSLEGQLTGSVMAEADEDAWLHGLQDILARRVGRLIYNGVPTGVEVCHSMHHGGPYPATTDSRFTSVGTSAIQRFARPVCFQNWPDSLLPPALQEANPLGILRFVDGKHRLPS
ncbi:MAG: aldehyde dehydrogenase (NADP(+)) [Bacteroidota bacterium]